MAKLIFTSHYMKHALPSHLEHYVKYIATREGVDQIDDTKNVARFSGSKAFTGV